MRRALEEEGTASSVGIVTGSLRESTSDLQIYTFLNQSASGSVVNLYNTVTADRGFHFLSVTAQRLWERVRAHLHAC